MMSGNNSAALESLMGELLDRVTEPQAIQACPVCGGPFRIRFEVYARGSRRLVGASGGCETCGAAVAVDSTRVPAWLEQTGR
jgi:hypothetical protein